MLADVEVYKVGHHGSLNATPRKLLWENFTKKGKSEALEQETTLLDTHDYPLGQNIRLSEKIIVKVS